jgi:hypothetical protein
MFVRTKTTRSGTVKHYLVECRREGGKVRQKVLWYLGEHRTVEAELAWLEERARHYREVAARWRAHAEARKDNVQTQTLARGLPESFDRDAAHYERERDRLLSILHGQHL